VDVIYLDESMTCTGKYVVDGVDGSRHDALMRRRLKPIPTWPSRPSSSCAHGEVRQSRSARCRSGTRFPATCSTVREGGRKASVLAVDSTLMDAFDCWGYMLPGAHPTQEKTWLKLPRPITSTISCRWPLAA